MKARLIASAVAGIALALSAAGCNPCDPTSQRQLQVTNNSSETIWIGGGGGALRAVCVDSNIPSGSCLTSDYQSNGTCSCTGATPPLLGTLACPGDSSPLLPSANAGRNCGCYQDSDCGQGAGCNTNTGLCYYTLPQPVEFLPTSNPWEVSTGGTLNFCLDAGTVTYPTPVNTPMPTPSPTATPGAAPALQDRTQRLSQVSYSNAAAAAMPSPTATAAQIPSAVWWSGGVFARTGCNPDGKNCATGDCDAVANSNCSAGVGGVNPATIAEFTLQRQATDFYDITIINGVNIAEQMAPIPTPTQSPPVNFINPATYWCTAPGSSCNWNLGQYIAAVPIAPTPMSSPAAAALMPRPNAEMQQRFGGDLAAIDPDAAASATTDYTTWLLFSLLPCSTSNTPSGCPTNFTCSGARGGCFKTCATDSDCAGTNQPHCVLGGGPTTSPPTTTKYCQCQAESECGSSNFCGPQFIPGLGQFLQTCGAFGGWWSVDDFCANASNVVGPFNCNQQITDGNGTTTTNLASLLGCTQNGTNGGDNSASCYNSAARNKPTCCGCATDSANPLSSLWPAAPSDACYDNNTMGWAAQAQPLLANLKQACPTAYSYPFDDVTSTFQCQAQGSVNLLGYQITFADLVPPPTPAPTP